MTQAFSTGLYQHKVTGLYQHKVTGEYVIVEKKAKRNFSYFITPIELYSTALKVYRTFAFINYRKVENQ